MSDKYIRFRTEETAGPVVNDPRGHGHDVLIPRSAFEAVALKVLADVASDAARSAPNHAKEAALALGRLACFAASWEANRAHDIPIPPEDCGERPGCRACGLGCGEEEDAPEEGDNGWSPSPPFTEPVIVSRCANPDTIPAEPVRELVERIHADSYEHEMTGTRVVKLLHLEGALAEVEHHLPPRKPHGTVDAHLAEQMKDPEFGAEYLREAAERAAEARVGKAVALNRSIISLAEKPHNADDEYLKGQRVLARKTLYALGEEAK